MSGQSEHVGGNARRVYESELLEPETEGGPYRYRVKVTTPVAGKLPEVWVSPIEPLRATTVEAARAEARDRTLLVVMLAQGATMESLAPRGMGDDGEVRGG